MGILVIQDMVSLAHQREPTPEQQENFERELEIMVNQFKSYPSITTWVCPRPPLAPFCVVPR